MPVTSWTKYIEEADSGPKPLNEGETYNFVINDLPKAGVTKNDYPKYTVVAIVESGERANYKVYHDFNLSQSTGANKAFFFDALSSLGLNREFFKSNPTDDQICGALKGKRFTAQATVNDYNGKKSTRLQNIAPPAGPAPASGGVPSSPATPQATPQMQQPVQQAAPVQQAQVQQPVQQAAPVQQPQQPVSEDPWASAPAPQAQPQQSANEWTQPPALPFQ